MNLNTDAMGDGYNSHTIINDVSTHGSEWPTPNNDLMVFPDDVIVAWDEYDPITYEHLGNHCHVVTPEDDEYLAILILYNKQQDQ